MKIEKKLTPEEVEVLIPKGLIDALNNPQDVIYCSDWAGIRNKEHEHGGQFYEPSKE